MSVINNYYREVMNEAVYLPVDNGMTKGLIVRFEGLEALGCDLIQCKSNLGVRLEERIILNIIRGEPLPAVPGVAMQFFELLDEASRTARLNAMAIMAEEVANFMNNMFMAISVNCEISLLKIQEFEGSHSEIIQSIEMIQDCLNQGVMFTQKLQAFAGHQHRNPRVINLATFVPEMLEILRDSLINTFDLRIAESQTSHVVADPRQIEVVVRNLVFNARDSSGDARPIIIEIINVEISPGSSLHSKGVAPGPYSLLTVGDSGHGMDWKTQRRVFDPFFTTKGSGLARGLGLSVVYGIVKQNGGWVDLLTNQENGTAVRVFLPRFDPESSVAA